MASHRNSLDASLRERAARVVPSGMWGHQHAAGLPEGYPQFFARGEGGVLWDVDGNRYMDLMCSWGPNMLGHRHPEVEEAVQRQRSLGDCLNGPADVMVELAEKLVDTVGQPFADAGLSEREDNRQLGANNFWLAPTFVRRLAHLGWGFGPSVTALGLACAFDHDVAPVSVHKTYATAATAFPRGR